MVRTALRLAIVLSLMLQGTQLPGQSWDDPTEEAQELIGSDAVALARFGQSVAVSGDLAVVGAHRDGFTGSAYVFRYDPDEQEWAEEQNLTASDASAFDRVGYSVAISGDLIVVGAYQDDDNGTDSGAAYVFRYDNGDEEWLEEQKLTASDASSTDFFGYSVAVQGGVVLIGAFGDDPNGTRSGSAYTCFATTRTKRNG